jgi:hypothetical protein
MRIDIAIACTSALIVSACGETPVISKHDADTYAAGYDDGVSTTCNLIYRHSQSMSEDLIRANICPRR